MTKSSISTDTSSINNDAQFFILQGRYTNTASSSESITASFKRGVGKKVMRGNKEYEKLSDHIGRFPLVMIAPQDIGLVSSAPDYRRRFLNAFLSQIDAYYLALMMRYNAVLASRNALLKKSHGQIEVIEIMSEQLSDLGDKIYALRLQYIEQLAPVVGEYYRVISGDKETIGVSYKSQLRDGAMFELLRGNLERDLILGYTSVGIHRDDIELTMNGQAIKNYGSQGQQKSLLIALKLAEASLIARRSGKKAILLLDDVFDKLDMARVENLISLVSTSEFGQIFITDSNKVRLESIVQKFDTELSIFEVDNGQVIIKE